MFLPTIAQGLIITSGTPTIDGSTDGAMSVDFTATTLKTTIMGYVKTVQENLQLIKSRYEQYKNDFNGVMNGENKAPIPGTRTIEDSQLAASDDPTAVQRAVYDLFMTYPSSDYKVKQACDKKLTQFYIDTIIEINTAAQKLEQEFNNELKDKVENLTSDIMGGENGAEVADSNRRRSAPTWCFSLSMTWVGKTLRCRSITTPRRLIADTTRPTWNDLLGWGCGSPRHTPAPCRRPRGAACCRG